MTEIGVLHAEMAKRRAALIDRSKRNPLIHLSLGGKSKNHIRFVTGGIDGIRQRLASGLIIKPSMHDMLIPEGWNGNDIILPHGAARQRLNQVSVKIQNYYLVTESDGDDPMTDLDGAELEKRLSALARKSKTHQAETGLNPLNVAFGTMRWSEDERAKTIFESPVVICPVGISREIDGHRYRTIVTSADEEFEVNPALKERLHALKGIDLPQMQEEETIGSYLNRLAGLLADDLIEVLPTATITTLPASRMAMWRDLDPSIWPEDALSDHPVVPVLLSAAAMDTDSGFAGERDVDAIAIADNGGAALPRIIYDADASQMSVILDIRENPSQSIAVEGPPGTGKSQTIANIIADALDRGLKILFVAEKQAALDVVAARLRNRGMGPLLFEMHSDTGTKAGVIAQIKKRLRYEIGPIINPDKKRAEIQSIHANLRARANAPGIEIAANVDLNTAIWRAIQIQKQLSKDLIDHAMTMEDPGITIADLDEVSELVQKWIEIEGRIQEDDPWSVFRLDLNHRQDRQAIRSAARMLLGEITRLLCVDTEVCGKASHITFEDFKRWAYLIDLELPRVSTTGPEITEAKRNIELHRQVIELDDMLQRAQSACREIHVRLEHIRIEDLISLMKALESHCCVDLQSLNNKLTRKRQRLDEMLKLVRTLDPLRKIIGSDTPQELRRAHDMLGAVAEHQQDAIALSLSRKPGIDRLMKDLENNLANIREKWIRAKAPFKPNAMEADNVENDMAIVRDSRLKDKLSGKFGKSLNILKSLLSDPPADASSVIRIYDEAKDAYTAIENLKRPEFFPEEEWKEIDTDVSQVRNRIASERAIRVLLVENRISADIADDVKAARWLHDDTDMEAALCHIEALCRPNDSIFQLINENDIEIITIERLLDTYAHLPLDLPVNASTVGAVRDLATIIGRLESMPNHNAIVSRRILSDIERIERLDLVEPFKTAIFNEQNPEVYLKLIQSDLKKISDPLTKVQASLRRFCHLMRVDSDIIIDVNCPNWKGLASQLQNMISEDADEAFDRNIDLNILRGAMERSGGFDVVKILPNGIPHDQISNLLKLATYVHRIRVATRGDARDILEKGEVIAERSMRFRELDSELQQIEAKRIVSDCIKKANVPDGISHGAIGDFTERALLEREVEKVKRHIPVRQLVRRAGQALQELMPVWLMSPSSVAQSIPPGSAWFDMVIIDEASQMRPENAIGSLLRGRQAIIVGDRNQMPPNRQFEVTDDEIDEEKASIADDAESILDLANARLSRKRRLRWHYRSRHPDLIAFSNVKYYQDDLVVMPAPRKAHGLLGVHSHYVCDARYDDGLNVDEAKVVIETATNFMTSYPDATLAIVALNAKQSDWISMRMEEIALKNRDVRNYIEKQEKGTEPFIVRNLENIQGDERDVIIISTVYGPNASGRASAVLSSPLNRSDGHRRLNVLVSRARSAVHLVTSMLPGEIGRSGPGHRGVDDFKAYLTYARTRELSHARQSEKGPDSEFEVVVSQRLKDAGFTVDYQIGVKNYWIDLGIGHPDWPYGYIAGVECDGAPWHRGLAVRDRDAIRQGVLEKMGWHIIRCWSTDWYGDQHKEGNRLEALLKERLVRLLAEEPPLVAEDVVKSSEIVEDREYGGEITDLTENVKDHIKIEEIFHENEVNKESIQNRWSKKDEPAKSVPVEATRDYNQWIVEDSGNDDYKSMTMDASAPEAKENLLKQPPNPLWRSFDLDGIPFYETIKGLGYVVWDEDKGEIGEILAKRTGMANGNRVREYIATLPNDREYHTSDLYRAVRWIRKEMK